MTKPLTTVRTGSGLMVKAGAVVVVVGVTGSVAFWKFTSPRPGTTSPMMAGTASTAINALRRPLLLVSVMMPATYPLRPGGRERGRRR
ncbi:MAG: hypothetical protein FGM25_06595 [Mycobacterium sp.]|nr:hypothetical protein [Mycobacterium sp.]